MADPTDDDVDPRNADDDATDDAADDNQDDEAGTADEDLGEDAGDDEGGEDTAEDDGGTVEDEPRRQQPDQAARQPGRGNRQFGQLRSENRELKRRLEEIERRTSQPAPGYDPGAELRRRQQEEAAEEERVRLGGDPAEISRFYAERAERRINERLGALAQNTADANDRAAFDRACDRNPTVARMRGAVERELENARRNGANPTRDAVLKYLLGTRVLERGPGAQTRQQRRADNDRKRQTARPGNSRGDTGGGAQGGGRRGDGNSHAAIGRRLDESGML